MARHHPLVASLVLWVSCGGTVEQSGSGGSAGTGGSAGSGGSTTARRSCAASLPGADEHCGIHGDVDCCGSSPVPGGTFNRLNDPSLPATVSGFELDVFEVTVGRFRAFVDAYPEARPKPGDGAHPAIGESGWRSEWDVGLHPTRQKLLDSLRKDIFDRPCSMWTDAPGENEQAPIGCVNWYVAFAFCAWDHGRLPTLAEWLFAAAGGDEHRTHPWGSADYDPSRAVYGEPDGGALIPVGSKPDGRARWGQYDMGGSRSEWALDFVGDPVDLPTPCADCADMLPEHSVFRVVRDMNYHHDPVSVVEESSRTIQPDSSNESVGLRCVRGP